MQGPLLRCSFSAVAVFGTLILSNLCPALGLSISPGDGSPVNETVSGIPVVHALLSVDFEAGLEKDNITLQLLDGEPSLTFLAKKFDAKEWYGELLEEHGQGTANFRLADSDKLHGSITLLDKVCNIATLPSGNVKVECILQKDFLIELDSGVVPEDSHRINLTDNFEGEDNPYIDVIVIYTLAAMCAEANQTFPCDITPENQAPIEERVKLAFQETTTAYTESNITSGELRLVHTYLDPNYTEVQEDDEFEASNNYQQMLNDLTNTGDGKLEEAHILREQYGADIVDLWVDVGGACGLAWGPCDLTGCYPDYAFAVMKRTCTTGYYTFSHENGHIQGCQHDRANDDDPRPFAYGWQDPDEKFRTNMAYDCENQTCGKIQRFSTPDVTWYGDAIGDEDNDNGRQIDLTWDAVASFRKVNDTDMNNETGGEGDTSAGAIISFVSVVVPATMAAVWFM